MLMRNLDGLLDGFRGRAELGKLRYPPWRRRVLVLLTIFPFVLGAVLTVTLGPLAGLAGFGAAFSLPAFFRHDLLPGPLLSTSIVTEKGHTDKVVFSSAELRVIDRKAIVEAGRIAARETAPEVRRPPPRNTLDLVAMPTVRSAFEPTNRDLQKFAMEIEDYATQLEAWLERYGDLRLQSSRRCRLVFRVENDGEAPAQNVRLRVRCAEGVRQLTEPIQIDSAPEQPRFRRPWDISPTIPLRSSVLGAIGRRLAADPPSGPVATASYENGRLVLTYEIGHLNHGPDQVNTEPVRLLPPSTEDFKFRWETLSANPGPAASGELLVRRNPSIEVEPPIETMGEIAEDQQLHYIQQAED